MTDSSTGGYLVPATQPAPLEDDALVDFLHDVVENITGLPGSLIRPRWQVDPPNVPDKATTWGSIGVTSRKTEGYPQTRHSDAGDTLVRYERLSVAITFYGPNCEAMAAYLRDGLFISQNREVMSLAGYALRDVSDIDTVPEIFKGQWLSRADVTVTIMRQIMRDYPVLSILSLAGKLEAATATSTLVYALTSQGLQPEPPIPVPPSPPTPTPTPPAGTQYGALYMRLNAAQAISGQMAVKSFAGVNAAYPDLTVPTDGELVVGVSVGAAQAGTVVVVQGEGEMTYSGWSWTPGPVFVGADGQLTQSPSFGISWVRQIGVALAADRILIDLQPLVLL